MLKPPANPLQLEKQQSLPSIDASALDIPFCHRGKIPTRRDFRKALRGETAREAIGNLEPGCSLFGFTKGQFSLIELISAVLLQIGESRMFVSTWTAASADIEEAFRLMESGALKDVRFLVDYTFQRRQPAFASKLRDLFGTDAVRVTSNHAKFVLLQNDRWNIVIRTSMNLNKNPRLEDFAIDDDPALSGYLLDLMAEVWDSQPSDCGWRDAPSVNAARFAKL